MSLNVQNSQGTSASLLDPQHSATVGTTATASLLLPPSDDAQMDAMSFLYLVMSKQQALDVTAGKVTITNDQKTRTEAYKRELASIQSAIEASKHRSFWDKIASIALDVGKVAAVVGSVAVAVASGGAGIVGVIAVAGAVLSSAGFVEGESQVLEKLGVDSGTAQWIGVGLSVAGAVCTGGAGLTAAGAEGVEGASTIGKLADTTGKAVSVAGGATTVAGGAAQIEASSYGADQEDDLADAMKAQFDQQKLLRLIGSMLEEIQSSSDSDEHNLSVLRGVMQTKSDTALVPTTLRA